MTTYSTVRDNFSLRPQYSIDLTITTSYVLGGTQVVVGNQAVKHTEVSNAPNSTGSPRSYSTPNGRAGSVSGNLAESGSDSSWAFSFTYPGVPQYQNIWGADGFFTRFYPDSDSIGTISISGSHSLLGSASAALAGIKHVYRTSFDANGGTVSPSSRDDDSGDSIVLPTPSRSGYNFDGWTSGGTNYGSGSYTVNATRTLVASWSVSTPAPVFSDGVYNYSTLYVGQFVNDYITASDTTSYSLITAPLGLSLQDYGSYARVTGTIAAQASTTSTITVEATGPGGSTESSDSFLIRQAPPEWTDTTLTTTGRIDVYYSSTFSATDATSWSITGSIPPGLSTSGTSGSIVTLSGTPTTAGSYTFYAQPSNSEGLAGIQESFTVTIAPKIPVWTDQTLDTAARVGLAYSSTVSASYVNSWSDGSLPSNGLSFTGNTNTAGSSTSTVSGTPINYGTTSFTLTPYNADNETPGGVAFDVTVYDAIPVWADQLLASSIATQDVAYSDGVAVSAGPVLVAYSIFSGSLPNGVLLDPATGVLSGTPTVPGVYTFVISATNGTNESIYTDTLTITVEAAGGYVKVWNGSAWVDGTAYVRVSGSWVEGTVNVRGASSWGASFSS